ncbi:MAG: sigma-70 family RNA polymerase sigma factor [Melioribacteraceae bacterium]|nr:sigma-70 family RNA polymerase sigma factor [Melioribacteraceae bacterium]MCF8355149.1 sigma-70 family RNA polymerase sigma factor [Melioribacteraceae bacterium]MCF8392478.1 sigma-70 family RNA polymerase sigma factor [Melioribacteraceae bacterium]MCF8418389.1 sigma-70 family RNA polymerase sigma factor [Melioribacteraceae bacterium]
MNNTQIWFEYKENPTVELKKQIILNYVKLVHYVIHNSKLINLDVVDERDYFQFGIEGLNEAIDRFDPEFGTKFETYAIQRIRGKIIDELRKLQIKPRPVQDNPQSTRYSNVSIDATFDSEGEGYTLAEVIPSDSKTPDDIVMKDELKNLLIEEIKNLEERDRLIITLYYYENLNYKEIASVLGITVSRISQVHGRIIQKLKDKIQKHYGEPINLAG